jgi:VWFA-related protein
MDYSGSLQDTPDALNDMQNGLVSFVQSLQASDRAEIIKFGTTSQVVQAFTSDKTALGAAILSQVDVGLDTLLFDTVNLAVNNTGAETNPRKAVIVITDGKDEGGNPPISPFSSSTLLDVINNANLKGVPIFTIGLGSNVNISNLTDMADQTGGHFFESQVSDNLNTIYQQIGSILFENQYVIDYSGGLTPLQSAFLTITANTTITGSDTKLITCP